MAPKRRATSAAKAGGKKIKQSNRKVDENCELSSCGEVYEDYDCILNQTNARNNNNKFYVIQVIKAEGKYFSWSRWGRVGEKGQHKRVPFDMAENAVQDFEKLFKDKTKNNWSDRMNFVSHPKKYTLIEVDCVDGNPAHVTRNARCTLDEATQHLIKLIFNAEMFKDVMDCMKLETGMMVLGKPSKAQIEKGFKVLEEIEAAINQKSRKEHLNELSSKFYTTIPHNFGKRKKPPIIKDKEIVEKKKEMLLVLDDIKLSQILKSETEEAQEGMMQNVPHPIDQHYNSLKCNLTLMKKNEEMFKIIENYLKATSGSPHKLKILNVWKVDRETEGQRFHENDSINNRRLLWHGTNIAVVAAILKSGLRIMPHSGGRVGCGIYFASESRKSARYVRSYKNTGMMFLSEVALGKAHTITRDDSSLKKPPVGYDSVVARGIVEPDPSKDISITLEGKTCAVPQGKPKKQPEFSDSLFHNSEYLIYKESQCRLRYLLELNMSG